MECFRGESRDHGRLREMKRGIRFPCCLQTRYDEQQLAQQACFLFYKPMYLKNSNGKTKPHSSAINSAALQDHLLRQFNFNLKDSFSQKTPLSKQPSRRKTHEKLPSINRGTELQIKKLEEAQLTSILPYEDEKLKKLKEARQDNIKMQKYNKGLTLAQKLGLVEAPPLPLTAKDWLSIQEKSKARNDSENCCSICLEDFKVQPQVLLSCSHVFHSQCLGSYQKHNKVKCCPICRRRDYEKKSIDQALKVFTLKCILRIQRVFRGSQDRIRLYSRLVQEQFEAKSVRFKRRLIGFKMWKLSIKIQQKVKLQHEYFNKLMKEVEDKHQKSKQDILNEMIEIQRKKIQQTGQVELYLQKLGLAKNMPNKQVEVDWQSAKAKGVGRDQQQCAICLTALWTKQVCLLSCSHLFHANCVQGFERYSLPGNKNKCPCCRSHYQKRLLQPLSSKHK